MLIQSMGEWCEQRYGMSDRYNIELVLCLVLCKECANFYKLSAFY